MFVTLLFRYATRWRPVLGVLLLLGPAACRRQRWPAMIDTLGTPIDAMSLRTWQHWRDFERLAPIIVGGVVIADQIVARHVESVRCPGVYLDLHTVKVKVENNIRGDLVGSEVAFHYFSDGRYLGSRASPYHKRLFRAESGGRFVFFLTREREVLRSVGDVGDYSIRIYTGVHSQASLAGDPPGTRLSRMLLEPGEGVDLEAMASQLLDYNEIASVWSSRPQAVELLRKLTHLPEPIRSAACGVLTASYYGQYDCLEDIASDKDESSANRQIAEAELENQREVTDRVIRDLRDPARLGYQDFGWDSRRRLLEEFEVLLFTRNRQLFTEACTALRRYFPYESESKCGR